MKCLDTSVLIYAADTSSAMHAKAAATILQAAKGEWPSCVCYQSLCEFAEILTDGERVKNPLTPSAARKFIERLIKFKQPQILYPDEAILRQTFKLMEKYPVLKRRFREANIVATIRAHGVKILVTANSAPFLSIRELEVENPFEALFA